MAAAKPFNPAATTIHEGTLARFLREPVSGDLEDVPGIGPSNKNKMSDAGVTNTHQLIGRFLMFKESDDVEAHMNSMVAWLREIGISNNLNNIVLALAEKCDIFMPGIYDSTLYLEE